MEEEEEEDIYSNINSRTFIQFIILSGGENGEMSRSDGCISPENGEMSRWMYLAGRR